MISGFGRGSKLPLCEVRRLQKLGEPCAAASPQNHSKPAALKRNRHEPSQTRCSIFLRALGELPVVEQRLDSVDPDEALQWQGQVGRGWTLFRCLSFSSIQVKNPKRCVCEGASNKKAVRTSAALQFLVQAALTGVTVKGPQLMQHASFPVP